MPPPLYTRNARGLPVDVHTRGVKPVLTGYAAVFYNPSDPGTECRMYSDMVERIMPGRWPTPTAMSKACTSWSGTRLSCSTWGRSRSPRTPPPTQAFAPIREELFLPGVRAAVADWLDAVKRIEAFRRIVEDIQARGVGSNTFRPFNGRVPVSLADRGAFAEFARELIHDGHTDAATINAAFSNLI